MGLLDNILNYDDSVLLGGVVEKHFYELLSLLSVNEVNDDLSQEKNELRT